ncbi:MAG: competence/damage-inducible protein A, partial [Anaerolineae bacterium]|nr:competence/damage-inducible protein A [Anaerolineae bacterium]
MMNVTINAEVISIGTEILLGELTDTNSVYIAKILRDLGINLYFMTSVGDNTNRIASAIEIALSRADVVITCGGLGPTVDDMTRQGVAQATGRKLVFHQPLLDQIAARFATFNVHMTDNNRLQAYVPDGAVIIENPVGTAPSFAVEVGDKVVISLPGVPREMKFLMQERVIPYLRGRYPLGVIKAHILKAAGIGESMLDEMIGHELLSASNPTVGLAAHSGQIDIRITAKADTTDQADSMIHAVVDQIMAKVGRYIYGVNDEKIEQALLDLCFKHGIKLAVIEAGIAPIVSDTLRKIDQYDTVLVQSNHHLTPESLKNALSLSATDLREMASEAIKQVVTASSAHVGIAIVANPDVDEASDAQTGAVVAVYTPAKSA